MRRLPMSHRRTLRPCPRSRVTGRRALLRLRSRAFHRAVRHRRMRRRGGRRAVPMIARHAPGDCLGMLRRGDFNGNRRHRRRRSGLLKLSLRLAHGAVARELVLCGAVPIPRCAHTCCVRGMHLRGHIFVACLGGACLRFGAVVTQGMGVGTGLREG